MTKCPAFRTNGDRVTNREKINALIADAVKVKPRDHWLALLDEVGVPCSPILNLDEVIANPQCQALGMLQQPPDGGGSSLHARSLSADSGVVVGSAFRRT